jgi:DNA excision repair protein ERCC-1
LNQICAISNLTLILAFSSKDAAKYIEVLKTYEFKPADQLRQQTQHGTFSQLSSALTQIKSVNKTDVVTLSSNFDNFYDLVHADPAMLRELPGFGDQKVKRILDAFEEPFLGE